MAFGALGTPIITLNAVTGLPLDQLSAMVGRQLPFFSLIVPFWLVAAMAGWRGMREVWPACLTVGVSFAATQFLVSNYHGPWVVDIAGALVSMARTDRAPALLASAHGLAVAHDSERTWRITAR